MISPFKDKFNELQKRVEINSIYINYFKKIVYRTPLIEIMHSFNKNEFNHVLFKELPL